nr:MAG TPA: hypothetical protein [Caudoviricetes sp.]
MKIALTKQSGVLFQRKKCLWLFQELVNTSNA